MIILALKFLLLGILGIIIIQDFKFRLINLYALFLLLILLLWTALTKQSFVVILENWAINIIFIFFQFASLTLYFSVKAKRIVRIIDKFIGLGDLLFWIIIAVFFSPINFILFFFISLCISLVLHLCLQFFNIYKIKQNIPLAGLQAIVLSSYIFFELVGYPWRFLDEYSFISLISN